MKLFQEKPIVEKYSRAKDFVSEYGIGKGDFILASKGVYEKYFAPLGLEAHVEYKGKYGQGEPTDGMIDALLSDFRKAGCERIVAIGGGAVIDMAKILVLGGNAGAGQYFRREVPLKKVRKLIAVPTTCGAGSEVSNVSIAEISGMRSKLGLAADEIYADAAVLIPELLTELPYFYFATSAIDAFIHAIESFVSPRANLYTEMFSQKAMEMILAGFGRILSEGEEERKELLDDFLTASNLAGIAFGNAGTGMVHAMSYPLSGKYHVAHGEANYQFLTAVFGFYQRECPEGKIREMNRFLGRILGCGETAVYDELERLFDRIIARKQLRQYGMAESEIWEFAASVEKSQGRLLNQSYVRPSAEQMAEVYRKLW